jgi:ATP-binding cassette, subfamily B, bacterial
MWETSRPLSFAVAAYAIAASVLPNLVLIAAGHLVGEIPAAARDGLSSAAGHRLVLALGVTGAAYAAALVLGPVQSSLSSVVKWRLVYSTETRLMAAVSGPAGIAHLEDPEVLNDLAMAQGQLTGQMPADAPMTLALADTKRGQLLELRVSCSLVRRVVSEKGFSMRWTPGSRTPWSPRRPWV